MDSIPTIEQIVEEGKALRPSRAFDYLDTDYSGLCTTRVYDRVRVSDEIVELERVDGRIGAGYVRVSTPKQRSFDGLGDGFSEPDQLQRIVAHFVQERQAFQIFSDVALSGDLPYNDRFLIEHVRQKKAARYEETFRAVFLDSTSHGRYAPAEIAGMEAFLRDMTARLRNGGYADPDLDVAFDVDVRTNEERVASLPARRRTRARKSASFRPALTLLMRLLPSYHAVAATDLSRLARSMMLFQEIAEAFAAASVTVVGIVESLDWLNKAGQGKDLQGMFLSYMAEQRLREVMVGSFRGILAMLETGRPHGKMPYWLVRNKETGFAEIADGDASDGPAQAVRRLVDLYLAEGEDGQRGYSKVAMALMREGCRTPVAGKPWLFGTVREYLTSPALVGRQVLFGKEWDVLPRLIDDHTYWRIGERMRERQHLHHRTGQFTQEYLATGLFICHCGLRVRHYPRTNIASAYKCSAQSTQRIDKSRPHLTLHAADVDAFLDDLMRHHGDTVLHIVRSAAEGPALRRELEMLEGELAALQDRRTQKEGQAREQAKAMMDMSGLSEAAPEYQRLSRQIEMTVMTALLKTEVELEKQIGRRRRLLASAVTPRAAETLEERTRSWDRLPVREKNRLLTQVFEEIRVVGDPPHEYLVPKLRTLDASALPPIPLCTSMRGKNPWRRLPTVGEWIALVFTPKEAPLPDV